ncbi:hypothetical protein HaLaN_30555, partial [Haematococcus lacustris]
MRAAGSVHGSSQSNGAPGPRKSLGRLTTSLSAVSGSLKDASTSCICCLPNLGPAAVSNPTSWLGMADAATADEAMQLVEARLRQMDTHVRHLPFVLAAAMDSRLASLRSELL